MAAAYDRASEVKAFDETKAGVKGLVDAGVTQIPHIFYSPPEKNYLKESSASQTKFSILVIDMGGLSDDSIRRNEIVERSIQSLGVLSNCQPWNPCGCYGGDQGWSKEVS